MHQLLVLRSYASYKYNTEIDQIRVGATRLVLKVTTQRAKKKVGIYQKFVQKKANVFIGASEGENLKQASPKLEVKNRYLMTDNNRFVATKINSQFFVFKLIKNLEFKVGVDLSQTQEFVKFRLILRLALTLRQVFIGIESGKFLYFQNKVVWKNERQKKKYC